MPVQNVKRGPGPHSCTPALLLRTFTVYPTTTISITSSQMSRVRAPCLSNQKEVMCDLPVARRGRTNSTAWTHHCASGGTSSDGPLASKPQGRRLKLGRCWQRTRKLPSASSSTGCLLRTVTPLLAGFLYIIQYF